MYIPDIQENMVQQSAREWGGVLMFVGLLSIWAELAISKHYCKAPSFVQVPIWFQQILSNEISFICLEMMMLKSLMVMITMNKKMMLSLLSLLSLLSPCCDGDHLTKMRFSAWQPLHNILFLFQFLIIMIIWWCGIGVFSLPTVPSN